MFYVSIDILERFPWDTVKLLGNILIPLRLAFKVCKMGPEQHCY